MPSTRRSEPANDVILRPYRGAASYGAADREFFFGRREDAEIAVSLVLSHKLSLLHALSGMGKTSLLDALAMPMLEDQGWTTVRCRPHLDPLLTLKRAILDRVLPDPADEARAIAKIRSILDQSNGPVSSIAAAVAWFQGLARDTAAFGALQRYDPPLQAPLDGGEVAVPQRTHPFATRLFQYGTGLRLVERQVTAFEALASTGIWVGGSQSTRRAEVAGADFGKLQAFFEREEIHRVHAGVRRALEAPELPLAQFLQRLQALWGERYDSFGLVLVLDQFEEMFTRYVDAGGDLRASPRDALDWALRPAFFRELATVVNASDPALVMPPLRIMICMRDDFIANLDQLTQHTGPIAPAAQFHLSALTTNAARQAIAEPAELFHVGYEPALLNTIIEGLAKERRWVEPGHLQIVCEYLWEKSGQLLAENGGGTIPMSAMPDAGGARGIGIIISGHFNKILNFDAGGTPRTDAQKIEILDLLEPLMTQGGTRNIVERERLRLAPFRNIKLRTDLLEELNHSRILRTEPRLGGQFVEITHEFLIDPVLGAMRELFRSDQNAGRAEIADRRHLWARLPVAFQRLGEIQFSFRRAGGRQLDREELDALDTFAELVDFRGHPWIAEAMFRASIVAGLRSDDLARQMSRLEAHPVALDAEALLLSLDGRMRDEVTLDYVELRALVSGVNWPGGYSLLQRRFLLESAIANLWADQRDLVAAIAGEKA